MSIQTLLGDVPSETFLSEYYQRLPFTLPQGARAYCSLATWSTVGELLGHTDADVMIVRDGRRYEGPDPETAEAAEALSAEGYTILVRHAERNDPRLAELAIAFERDLGGAVDVHLYATPPGRHGFSWHYDAEDVFILQTTGRKEYSLRKNTVHPWPLVETIPDDMRYERELMPLMKVLLSAGDWLYIPCGYWHKADAAASDETAISLAVGVMAPAALDVLDFLRPRLAESLLWRQRLPVATAAAGESTEQIEAKYREIFAQLGDDLRNLLGDESAVRAFLQR
jgi:50S ribosomal protein L16 3-hydroxylase